MFNLLVSIIKNIECLMYSTYMIHYHSFWTTRFFRSDFSCFISSRKLLFWYNFSLSCFWFDSIRFNFWYFCGV